MRLPVINNEFRHNIVKVYGGSHFDNGMTKFLITNRADA